MELPEEWRTENCNLRISNNVITVSLRVVNHKPGDAKLDMADDDEGHFHFDLHQLSRQMIPLGGQYNLRRFAAIIRNFEGPAGAVLQFSNGRIVCTGARTLNQAEFIVRRHLYDLHRLGYTNLDIRKKSFVVQNIVASARLPGEIDLDKLAEANPADCMYTKELFPGAALRPKELKRMTVLVFPSGCIVATGGKSREDLERAVSTVMTRIYESRKRDRRTCKKRSLATYMQSARSTYSQQRRQDKVGRPAAHKKKKRIGRRAMMVNAPHIAKETPLLPDRSKSALF